MQPSEFNNAFGRLVRQRRSDARLSQIELAQRVGLSRASIANVESGRQGIPLHSLVMFATALGCAPAALLPETKHPLVTIRMGDEDADAAAFISRVFKLRGVGAGNAD